MPLRVLALAVLLLLLENGASLAQVTDQAPARSAAPPPSPQTCGPAAPKTFVQFEQADGIGAIMVNPDLVGAVQTSPEKPKEWSLIRWADGQSVLVRGSVDVVSRKLTHPSDQ